MSGFARAVVASLSASLLDACCGPTCDCIQDEPYQASLTFTSNSRELNALASDFGVEVEDLTCEQVCESQPVINDLESCEIRLFSAADGTTSAEVECSGINYTSCE
jgi:hypothetical protein